MNSSASVAAVPVMPASFVVKPEVVLEGHRGQRDVFGLDRHAFLGLDRLMQTVRQAAALHHAAGEFVDQHHLAVAHDIVLILVEQLVRAQGLRDVMHDASCFRGHTAIGLRAACRPRAAAVR